MTASPGRGTVADTHTRPRWPIVLLAGAAVVVLGAHWFREFETAQMQDLVVYLGAARDVPDGTDPYAVRPALPFTYPPAWALACIPLTLLPLGLAKALFFALSAVLTVWILHRLSAGMTWRGWWCLAAVFAAPFSRSLYEGQVNIVLSALVLADYLALPARFRGVGTGLAAAVKVTPVFMALPLLVRRDWGSLARLAGTLIGVSLTAYLVLPGPSTEFWTELLWDPTRVGGVEFADNQSLLGFLTRLTDPSTATTVSHLLVVPVLVLTVAAVARQHRTGTVLGELSAAGLGGLLISPISWSHHWIWLVTFSALLARQGRIRLALVVLLPMVVDPAWLAGPVNQYLPPVPADVVLSLTLLAGVAALVSLMTHVHDRPLEAASCHSTRHPSGVE